MKLKNFMKGIFFFIISKLKLIILNTEEKKFIIHNKALFFGNNSKSKKILIEIHGMQPNHIAISHFSKVLSDVHNASLIGYYPDKESNVCNIKLDFKHYKIKKIYRSFGVKNFLRKNTNKFNTQANELSNKLFHKINSKSDLVDLFVDDILVGDLIYDQYLAQYRVPTIEIKSKRLRKILFDFSLLYYYWLNYFSKNNVSALVISHACYFKGLSARIAISLNIPVYQVNLTHIYYLSKHNLFPYADAISYKDTFERFNIKKK